MHEEDRCKGTWYAARCLCAQNRVLVNIQRRCRRYEFACRCAPEGIWVKGMLCFPAMWRDLAIAGIPVQCRYQAWMMVGYVRVGSLSSYAASNTVLAALARLSHLSHTLVDILRNSPLLSHPLPALKCPPWTPILAPRCREISIEGIFKLTRRTSRGQSPATRNPNRPPRHPPRGPRSLRRLLALERQQDHPSRWAWLGPPRPTRRI